MMNEDMPGDERDEETCGKRLEQFESAELIRVVQSNVRRLLAMMIPLFGSDARPS